MSSKINATLRLFDSSAVSPRFRSCRPSFLTAVGNSLVFRFLLINYCLKTFCAADRHLPYIYFQCFCSYWTVFLLTFDRHYTIIVTIPVQAPLHLIDRRFLIVSCLQFDTTFGKPRGLEYQTSIQLRTPSHFIEMAIASPKCTEIIAARRPMSTPSQFTRRPLVRTINVTN